MNRARIAGIVAGFLGLLAPAGAEACKAVCNGDTDSFLLLAPHPFAGSCGWRSATATDQGIEAVLSGYAVVGDGTGAGVTIRCWLEYSSTGADVPNTDTQNGAPGSAAFTARLISVPLGVATRVCAYAEALFVTPEPRQEYRTYWCTP